MTADEIRAAYYTKPFLPFVVRLTDGRKFPVSNRKYLAISPLGSEITIGLKGSFVFIKLPDIASLDFSKKERKRQRA